MSVLTEDVNGFRECANPDPAHDGLMIGERVKQLRKAKRMTQTALAKAVGITPSAVSLIESGNTRSLRGRR